LVLFFKKEHSYFFWSFAMPKIQLLLADVDGTLVTKEKVLTPRAIASVQALRAHGIAFAITSGRPPKGMQMLIEPLGIDTPIAGFNGGMWVNPDLSLIEAHTLPRDVAERALALLQGDGLDVWVYSGEDWLVHNPDAPHVTREQWTVKFPPKITNDFSAALESAVKIVGVSDDLAKVEACEKRVQEALGDSASAARSQPYYIDITHPQANKGFALGFLAKRLGIPETAVATIGDQPNDTLMFCKGGLSIAMGNASEAVQKQATYVTTSSEEEGFANAIEKFLLGGEHG
jgi:Cof subfamily protein (haloacid dehalogenase superfamily)